MDAGVIISVIAAVADNGVIGRGGDIPWQLRSDLLRFAELTKRHTIIVGRKTHEAILKRLGHPLRGRRTIVITRQVDYAVPDGCEVAASWKEALVRVRGEQEVFVIGGAEIYCLAFPYATRMYLTEVHTACAGDAFFPEYNAAEWDVVHSEFHGGDAGDDCHYTFKILKRLRAPAAAQSVMEGFVVLKHAREDDQRGVMERIKQKGGCPFCPEHRTDSEVLEPVWRGRFWSLAPNRWPYQDTQLHLIGITERHIRFPHELNPEEWAEFQEILVWAVKHYQLTYGAVGIRFGDPAMTGATVDHFHFHLIVADPNVAKPGYQRVRFSMGPKPAAFPEEKIPDS